MHLFLFKLSSNEPHECNIKTFKTTTPVRRINTKLNGSRLVPKPKKICTLTKEEQLKISHWGRSTAHALHRSGHPRMENSNVTTSKLKLCATEKGANGLAYGFSFLFLREQGLNGEMVVRHTLTRHHTIMLFCFGSQHALFLPKDKEGHCVPVSCCVVGVFLFRRETDTGASKTGIYPRGLESIGPGLAGTSFPRAFPFMGPFGTPPPANLLFSVCYSNNFSQQTTFGCDLALMKTSSISLVVPPGFLATHHKHHHL